MCSVGKDPGAHHRAGAQEIQIVILSAARQDFSQRATPASQRPRKATHRLLHSTAIPNAASN